MSYASPVSPASQLGRPQRDAQFYFAFGDVVVLVEDYVFRVFRHFFERESAYFRGLFYKYSENSRGSSDSNPLLLDNVTAPVTAHDFRLLLWVIYERTFSLREIPVDNWVSILRVSNILQFDRIKNVAVHQLDGLDVPPIAKIALYEQCGVGRDRLLTSFDALVRREEPLTLEEGAKLGLPMALGIAQARELARGAFGGGRTPTRVAADVEASEDEVAELVREIFSVGGPATSSPHAPAAPSTGPGVGSGLKTGTASAAQPSSNTSPGPATSSSSSSSSAPDTERGDTTAASKSAAPTSGTSGKNKGAANASGGGNSGNAGRGRGAHK